MSGPPTGHRGHLALIAGTVLATLAVQRHLSRLAMPISGDDRQILTPDPRPTPRPNGRKILARTLARINADRILATAAGVVFYGLLAIFPAITALVSSYGLFADPSTMTGNLQSLATMLPDGSFAVVQDQISRVLVKETPTLGGTFILGLLMAIWSANAGMKAIFDALNVVYAAKETRSFLRLNLTSLAFTVAALAAILVMIAGVVAVPLALQRLGLGERAEWIIKLGRWPTLLLLLLMALGLLYRLGPSRPNARYQWFSVGALAASVMWLIGSSLLSCYLSNFGNYNATYGSLGAAIGLMTWMWMSAIVVLCGAELNSEIERRIIAGPCQAS